MLDSCSFRGASIDQLGRLAARGFSISISSIALMEVWARSARADDMAIVSNRARKLASVVDASYPIAQTGVDLIHHLGGQVLGEPFRRPDATLDLKMREVWRLLATGEATAEGLKSTGMATNSQIDELSAGWLDTSNNLDPELRRQVAALPTEEAVRRVGAWFAETFGRGISLKHGVQERLHGYFRLAALHAVKAATGAHTTTANDSEDLQLLMHLAEDVVLVTADFKLIQRVDETLSFQAPYVRTIGELLTNGAPVGPPWGRSARREAAKHSKREKGQLKALEDAGRDLSNAG